jgi:uncharacterized damage-inducible protein DinB
MEERALRGIGHPAAWRRTDFTANLGDQLMRNGSKQQWFSEVLIWELAREAETTRRVLERVPEAHLHWSPHPKSMSLGQLALHVASVPGGVAELLDSASAESPDVPLPQAESRDALLAALDASIATATEKLSAWGDEGLREEWRLTRDGQTILALSRVDVVRSIMLNHWYHHRGQLLVYLRLLDVPLPPVYGATADEDPFA